MTETIRIDDMRLFAKVAEVKSFTKAAALLSVLADSSFLICSQTRPAGATQCSFD